MRMARAAAASRCMRGWARMRCSRSALPRHSRTTSSRSTAARSSIPASTARSMRPGRSPKPLSRTGKPLDIQVTATKGGLDIDVRGSGPLSTGDDHKAVAHRGKTSAGTADAAWRAGADAQSARYHDRHRAGDPAAGLVPAGDDGRRRSACRACGEHCKRAKHVADLFCGVGPFALRLAAKSRVARLRQRRRRGRGAAEGRRPPPPA